MSICSSAVWADHSSFVRLQGSRFRALRDIEEFIFHPNSPEQKTGGKCVLYLGLTKRRSPVKLRVHRAFPAEHRFIAAHQAC